MTTTLPAAPAAIDLTAATWHIDAEDWQPLNPYGTLGDAGTLTNKVPVSLDLTGLKPWPDIPELANASGIGTYTTTVNLPAGWDASYGATLSLGQVTDTFALTVNGQPVGIDQVDPTVDIGPYLHAGANTIVVRVATTFNNRLLALDTAVRNRARHPELRPRRPGRPDAVPPGGGRLDKRTRPTRRSARRGDGRRARNEPGRQGQEHASPRRTRRRNATS